MEENDNRKRMRGKHIGWQYFLKEYFHFNAGFRKKFLTKKNQYGGNMKH